MTNDWKQLEQILIRLYPIGPSANEIWSRAGGDNSTLPTAGNGRAAWHAAVRTLSNGGGGVDITFDTLLAAASHDFPRNGDLRALASVHKKFADHAPQLVLNGLEVTLPATHLRALFEAHRLSKTDAIEGLRSFGVTREIYADDIKLANAAGRSLIDHVSNEFSVSNSWVDGTHDHIYSGAPGAEGSTFWRRSLRGAYDFIDKCVSEGETLILFIPHDVNLCALDNTEDVVDCHKPGYWSFFLVAKRMNKFATDRYRDVISDPLSYRPCRDGLFLLFLAAELRRLTTHENFLIDVWQTSNEIISACNAGKRFIVELKIVGGPFKNHADFIFYDISRGCLTASQDVSSRLVARLQQELNEFIKSSSARLPDTIHTSSYSS